MGHARNRRIHARLDAESKRMFEIDILGGEPMLVPWMSDFCESCY